LSGLDVKLSKSKRINQTLEEQMTQQPINSDITSDDKLWALLGWIIWPVAVVMLLMDDKKARPFIKYNAVLSLAYAVPLYVLGTITVGCLFAVGMIYAIVLGIQAYQGKWVTVPFLTDFIKKQGWVA
jgi:uncharacterized membrane protein